MATAEPADVPLDALSLIQSMITGDAKAAMVTLDHGDPRAIALQLARMAAGLLAVRTDSALEAIQLLREAATPG